MDPLGQHVHSLLEVMPVTGAFLLTTLRWDQAGALTGRGRPDFGMRLKRRDPLSVRARVRLLAAMTAFGILPDAEEQAEAVSAASGGAAGCAMRVISRLEQAGVLDKFVGPGQRIARSLPPGRLRDGLHGVWLGHPLHPVLVQAPAGAWLSASVLDLMPGTEQAVRRLTAFGLCASVPAAMAGAADWSEQHEQQMRVGVVHALANSLAIAGYGSSLACRSTRLGRLLRLGGLAALASGGLLGGHLSFRLAGGANHAEAVPHLMEPGWHHLMAEDDVPEGKPVRQMLGEVPVVAIRQDGQVHVLADRCSHMSGPLADGDLAEGRLTCPWHGSIFSICDGSVARGPATAPQPVFETRSVGGAIQVLLPGAG